MKAVCFAVAAALCLAVGSGQAAGQEMTQIGGVVNYVEASGSVSVNGVPATEFSTGEGGSGGTGMGLTDLLVNGTNEIVLVVEPVTENGRATLELATFSSSDPILTLEQEGKGEASGTIEVDDLPDWSWTRATPQDEAAPGLADAVTAYHEAFTGSDLDGIVAMAGPFLADQGELGGLDEAVFREEIAPLLEEGELKELQALTIARYADGKLFRVTDPAGEPPINLEFESEGLSGAVRTGEWWSFLDGEWKVAR